MSCQYLIREKKNSSMPDDLEMYYVSTLFCFLARSGLGLCVVDYTQSEGVTALVSQMTRVKTMIRFVVSPSVCTEDTMRNYCK